MRLRTIAALATLALPLFGASGAFAQRVSPMPAGRFVQFCNSPRGGGQQICDAYITGMADSFALVAKLDEKSAEAPAKSAICVPRTASGQTMRDMVISWIDGHKEKLRDQVGEVVFEALHDSYPCDPSKSGSPN